MHAIVQGIIPWYFGLLQSLGYLGVVIPTAMASIGVLYVMIVKRAYPKAPIALEG